MRGVPVFDMLCALTAQSLPIFLKKLCPSLVLNNNILRPLQLNAMVAHLSIPRAIGYWSVEFKHSAVLEKPMAAPHTDLC